MSDKATWTWEYKCDCCPLDWRPSGLIKAAQTAAGAAWGFAEHSARWPNSREKYRLRREGVGIVATIGLRIGDQHKVRYADGTKGTVWVPAELDKVTTR